MEEVNNDLYKIIYAKIGLSREGVLKRANGLRRVRTFWDKLRPLKRDPGVGSGIAAIMILLFPITYPLYLLFSRPQKMEWLRLVLWPFYQLHLQAATAQGVRKTKVWVEGMKDGLSQGLNQFGTGIWGMYRDVDARETHGEPFVASPSRHLRVAGLIEGNPPEENTIVLPHSIGEGWAAEYVTEGAGAAAAGKDSLWVSDQFRRAFDLRVSDLRNLEVIEAKQVHYPIWLAKYQGKNVERLLALRALRGSVIDRLELSTPATTNPVLRKMIMET